MQYLHLSSPGQHTLLLASWTRRTLCGPRVGSSWAPPALGLQESCSCLEFSVADSMAVKRTSWGPCSAKGQSQKLLVVTTAVQQQYRSLLNCGQAVIHCWTKGSTKQQIECWSSLTGPGWHVCPRTRLPPLHLHPRPAQSLAGCSKPSCRPGGGWWPPACPSPPHPSRGRAARPPAAGGQRWRGSAGTGRVQSGGALSSHAASSSVEHSPKADCELARQECDHTSQPPPPPVPGAAGPASKPALFQTAVMVCAPPGWKVRLGIDSHSAALQSASSVWASTGWRRAAVGCGP